MSEVGSFTNSCSFLCHLKVSTVKDPTSDMATCARNGSAAVASQREKREGMKSRQRFWELGGTAMGNALGVQVGVAVGEEGECCHETLTKRTTLA